MRKVIVNFSLILFFSLFLIFAGCKDTITGDDIDSRFIPSVNVSFNEHIQPIFNYKCNYSGCHNSEDAAGGLMLTTWASTTANPSIVFPGDPDNSILIWTIRYEAGTRNMPPLGYQPLTEQQIEGIETWVAEGAKAN